MTSMNVAHFLTHSLWTLSRTPMNWRAQVTVILAVVNHNYIFQQSLYWRHFRKKHYKKAGRNHILAFHPKKQISFFMNIPLTWNWNSGLPATIETSLHSIWKHICLHVLRVLWTTFLEKEHLLRLRAMHLEFTVNKKSEQSAIHTHNPTIDNELRQRL